MKLGDEVIAGVRRKRLRRHRVQVEIENIDLPRAQTQGAMESEADFNELSRVRREALAHHATGQLEQVDSSLIDAAVGNAIAPFHVPVFLSTGRLTQLDGAISMTHIAILT